MRHKAVGAYHEVTLTLTLTPTLTLTLTLTLTPTITLTLNLTLTQHKGKHGVSAHNKDLFMRRLRRAGVDLSRVGFVQQQPHHRLGLGLGLG